MANPIVTITMENGDVMKAELYPDIAPNTVNNFISPIKKGFYDGIIFHRVIKGFMIQGGDLRESASAVLDTQSKVNSHRTDSRTIWPTLPECCQWPVP